MKNRVSNIRKEFPKRERWVFASGEPRPGKGRGVAKCCALKIPLFCNALASNGRQCLKAQATEMTKQSWLCARTSDAVGGKGVAGSFPARTKPRAASASLGVPIDAPATVRTAATRHARRSAELVKETGRLQNSYFLTVNGGARRAGYARRTGLFGDNSSLWSKHWDRHKARRPEQDAASAL